MTFPTGRYAGKSPEYVLFHDPGHFEWLLEKGVPGRYCTCLADRIRHLNWCAIRLRLPCRCARCPTPAEEMLLFESRTHRLGKVEFVCRACAAQAGPDAYAQSPSFFGSRAFHDYDKRGGRMIVAAIKRVYFGSSSYRMTARRMAAFFDNPENFLP